MSTLPTISPELVKAYQEEINKNSSAATAKRKAISLNRFFDWAKGAGHISENPIAKDVPPPKPKASRRTWATIGTTIALVILLLLLTFKIKSPIPFVINFAQEANLQTTENKTLPTASLPANTAVNGAWNVFAKLKLAKVGSETLSFKIYNSDKDGTPLYTSDPQTVTTDSNGSALISLDKVPTELFFQNDRLYLEPQMGSVSGSVRIPVSTASTPSNINGFFPSDPNLGATNETVPIINADGTLLLASQSPAIKAKEGNFLLEGQAVTMKTTDGSDGNIEINPDGKGIAHFLFEGTKGDFLNAQGPNLTSGSLYYGMVPNNATGYDLIKLQSGSPKMSTKFSVDAVGNTYIAKDLNVKEDISTNGIDRLTSAGALKNITGYTQNSGNFTINQTAGDTASITKKTTALSDVLNLTLNEDMIAGSHYNTLTLNRIGGDINSRALLVDQGDSQFDGQVQIGRFTSNPTAVGAGSLVYNSTDNQVYVWDGTTWTAMGGAGTSAFSGLTSGTNTTATMVVGSGASLNYSGTGTINASTLNSVSDTSFLRSDTSDNFTSGTLTTDAGTVMDVNGDLVVSDTNIVFDGASTTFTTTGDLTLNIGGGDLILTNTQVINIGGSGSDVAYNVIGDSTTGASASMNSDDDLYIEGDLEVEGSINGLTINPGGFTAGSVTFIGSAGELSEDNTNFFWNDSTNRLGIGDNTPAATLTVGNGDLFQVDGATGNITTAGDIAINGGNITTAFTADSNVTVTGTLTANGVLNANSLFTLGDNGDTGTINTSDWDINSSGDLSGIGSIAADGDITLTQATPSIFLTDNTAASDDFSINTDASTFTIVNATDTRTDLSIDGTGNTTFGGNVSGANLFQNGNAVCDASGANCASSATVPFSGITSSTNTTAAMVVGSGASLDYTGTGTINASSLEGKTWEVPGTIGSTTPNSAAFTTLTSSGNTTLGTGASSVNTIGSTTTPGTLTLHGATTLDNTFTVSGSNLTSLGGNLTVTGTVWTATPTISGLITATSGLTANGALTANNTFTLGDNGDTGTINTSDWDVSATGDLSGIGTIAADGDITLTQATPSLLFVDSTAASDDYSINIDANAFNIVNDTDGRTELSFAGNGAITLGSATATTINLTTDGTGDAEVVLPDSSVGPNEVFATGQSDEYCLTYETTGGTFEWQNCGASASVSWSSITDPTGDLTLNHTTFNSTFNWDPGADSAETNFSLTTQGEDTTAGGDEDQVLLSLAQTSNGVNVDQAADALITLANNDANDAVVNAIRFDAGAAGTDFTYGINFDAASIGTAELILQNAETIDNVTDGTVLITSPLTKTSGNVEIAGTTGLTFSGVGGDITFTNAEKIDNDTDGTVAITSPITSLSGVLTINGATGNAIDITNTGITTDISLQNGEAIDNNVNGTITLTATSTALSGDLAINGGNITTAFTADSTVTVTGTTTTNGTLTANGIVTLGDNGDTVAINSSDWDISATGNMTGIGAITMDGNFSQTGATTFSTGTGTVSLNGNTLITANSGTGLNINDTGITTDISLQNGETIDNNTDGSINLGATVLELTGGTTIHSDQTTVALLNTTTTTLNVGGAATTINLGPTGNGASTVVVSGGSADTGCTFDGSNGNLTCSGTISGSSIVSTLKWNSLTSPDADLTLNHTTWNTIFNWDPGADAAETNFSLTTQGEDTTAGGDESQVLLALSQTSNGADVDQAADALVTLTNSDSNDPVGSAIRFDAGAAGTDFTYGINFDAASIGTAELIFQNAETIDNTVDGTLAITAPTTALSGDLAISGGNITTAVTADLTLTVTGTTTTNGTLNANGVVTLGDNGDTVAINSSDWDISTAGAMTGISGITNDGAYTQTGTSANTFTGPSTFSYVNSADSGTTNNTAKIALTTPADTTGTNVHQFLFIDPAIGNATGGTNTVNLIATDAVTGDAEVTLNALNVGALTGTAATEIALNIGAGWDSVLSVNGTPVINGSGQIISTQLNGTLFTAAGDSGSTTIIQGDTLTIAGGTNGIDTTEAADTVTLNLDTTEIGTTTFGSGSAITWTFDASGGTDTTLAFGDGEIDLTGKLSVSSSLQVGSATNLAYSRFGTATTGHGFTTSQDVLVGGNLELDGILYLDGRTIANPSGTATIILATDPSAINDPNILDDGSWWVNNAVNPGMAALMVNQAKGGDIFSASASGVAKMTLTNAGNLGVGDTTPDAVLDIDAATTTTAGFGITDTGVHTGTGTNSVATIVANAATTGDILTISATSLTSGTALTLTGPSSTGVTDHFVKITSDVASGLGLLNLNPDFTTGGYGIYNYGTDSTANANQDTGYSGTLELTGDAAKIGYGIRQNVLSSSTTGDTLTAGYFQLTSTGALGGATTRNDYGIQSVPVNTGANSNASSAINVYGGLFNPQSSGPTTGTTTVYGGYFKTVATHAADAGTVNQYGLYVANDATTSTNGTSTKYGLYIESPTGADTNYAAIFAGGNVGIGTTAPQTQLSIKQSDADTTQLTLGVQGSWSVGTHSEIAWSSTAAAGGEVAGIRVEPTGSGDWGMQFLTTTGGGGSYTPQMTIMHNGNVGIGDTTPAALFTVGSGDLFQVSTGGNVTIAAASGTGITIGGTGIGNDIVLQNSETIDNNTDGVISLSGVLNISAASGNAITIANTGITTDIVLQNGSTIDENVANLINLNTGANGAGSGVEVDLQDTATAFGLCHSGTNIATTGQNRIIVACSGAPTDIAEFYPGISDAEPGDIMTLIGDITAPSGYRAIKSTSRYDQNAIGAVSTIPTGPNGDVMGETTIPDDQNPQAIGLAGRVVVKVSLENGSIATNDWLTTSSTPGVAMKATKYSRVIGRALENYDGSTQVSSGTRSQEYYRQKMQINVGKDPTDPPAGVGKILAMTNLTTYDPDLALNSTGDINITQDTNGNYQVTNTANNSVVDRIGAFANIVAANIKAGFTETKQLTADGIKTTQAAIDNLVAKNIKTEIISPIPGGTDVTVQIGSDATPSGKLAIDNAQGTEVASIDSQGNASFSGQIAAESVQTDTATVSGTLYADDIKSKSLDQIQEMLNKVKTDQDVLLAATSSANLNATGSAELSQLITSDLYVTNQAAINSLSLTQSLTLGSDFAIDANGINTISEPLKLQSLAMAPVEIMAGLVTIDTHGNVNIAGNLYVAGKITTPKIEVADLAVQNLTIAASSDATPSGTLASGDITTNATAGKGIIPAGTSEIVITNPKVTDYSLVYVTPTSTTQNNVLYIKSKSAGQFTVGFTNAITVDAEFNWWIVQVSP